MVGKYNPIDLELMSDINQSSKGRAYTRYMRETHIQRKMRIDKEVHNIGSWYKFRGQYSKGKIHCSCPMCAVKTRVNGRKISEKRKLIELEDVREDAYFK